MGVSWRHALSQGPMLVTLLRTGSQSAWNRFRKAPIQGGGALGVTIEKTLPPRPVELIRDYVRHLGGDPAWYKGTVPPHLFPQWGIPMLALTMRNQPYDLTRVLNGGCKMEVNAPMPADESIQVRSWLDEVDDNGKRAIFHQRLVSGTASQPDALDCHVTAFLPRTRKSTAPGKPKPCVPKNARQLARWRLKAESGLDFALLTGDFNPIHWLAPYARLAGFSSTILHGFAIMGRAVESLNRVLWSGAPDRLKTLEIRFRRPLVLPAEVGLYIGLENDLYVGSAPEGPANLSGCFSMKEQGR